MGDGSVGAVSPFCDRLWCGDGVLRGQPVDAVPGGFVGAMGRPVWSGRVFLHAARSDSVVAGCSTAIFVEDDVDWDCDSHHLRGIADCVGSEEVWEVGRTAKFEIRLTSLASDGCASVFCWIELAATVPPLRAANARRSGRDDMPEAARRLLQRLGGIVVRLDGDGGSEGGTRRSRQDRQLSTDLPKTFMHPANAYASLIEREGVRF